MGFLRTLFGGGGLAAVGSAAKDIQDVFTTSDRERLEQYEAETRRIQTEQASRMGQIRTNQAEARQHGFFTKWRPGAGWVCVIAMAYHYLLYPIVGPFVLEFTGVQLTEINWQELSVVLMGLLGMGGIRTIEKVKNVARSG